MAHLANDVGHNGRTYRLHTETQHHPRPAVVTTLALDGALVATWRTVFTPELLGRDPAAVDQLLAEQHVEAMDCLQRGGCPAPLAGAPVSVPIAAPRAASLAPSAVPAPAANTRAPDLALAAVDSEGAPAAHGGKIPHNHPAFAGLPMLEWEGGDATLEWDLVPDATPPAPRDAPPAPREAVPRAPSAPREAVPPLAVEAVAATPPPVVEPTPARPREHRPSTRLRVTRAKRPSLPAMPVVPPIDDALFARAGESPETKEPTSAGTKKPR